MVRLERQPHLVGRAGGIQAHALDGRQKGVPVHHQPPVVFDGDHRLVVGIDLVDQAADDAHRSHLEGHVAFVHADRAGAVELGGQLGHQRRGLFRDDKFQGRLADQLAQAETYQPVAVGGHHTPLFRLHLEEDTHHGRAQRVFADRKSRLLDGPAQQGGIDAQAVGFVQFGQGRIVGAVEAHHFVMPLIGGQRHVERLVGAELHRQVGQGPERLQQPTGRDGHAARPFLAVLKLQLNREPLHDRDLQIRRAQPERAVFRLEQDALQNGHGSLRGHHTGHRRQGLQQVVAGYGKTHGFLKKLARGCWNIGKNRGMSAAVKRDFVPQLFDYFPELRIGFHEVFHALAGVNHRRVIAATEVESD